VVRSDKLLSLGLVLIKSGVVQAVRHVVVLQFALSRLCTPGSPAVVKQQELQHRFSVFQRFIGLSANDHSFRNWRCAGGLEFGALFDLDEAHPATATTDRPG